MTQAQASELHAAVGRIKPLLRRAAFFSIVAGMLVLAPSAYMLEVYDRVVSSRNHFTLLMLTLAVLGAFVVMEVLEWIRARILLQAGSEMEAKLAPRVFDAVFQANVRRLQGTGLQPMVDLRTLREFVGSQPVTAVMESPASLLFLVIVFAISPVLGWVCVVAAVVQVALGFLNERGTQPPLAEANRAAIAAQVYADSTLRNAQVIEAMGMLKEIHARWMEKQREFLGLQALASERAGTYQSSMKFVSTVLASALLGLAAWLLLHNSLNGGPGMLIVASILGARILAPILQAVTNWRTVINARESWKRLDRLLAAIPAKAPSMELPAPKGMLQVEQAVAIPPGGSAPTLRGVNFALRPGEVAVVIGPSASGKTTLARLLTGLWPCSAGKVRLDGADVHTWDKTQLGPHVGYLPQGVELFDGTIADNIARFGEADPSKVEAAARAVGLHEYILSLPDGYDTEVGREGAVLSGGQRQRVGLARAVYGEPSFVVLDEPNSSLDEAGDAALAEAIRALRSRGTTFVIMTHRPNILAIADKILLLNEGAQQAFGPREEVLAALAKAAEQFRAHQAQQRAGSPTKLPAAA